MTEWRDSDFVGGHPALDFINTVADQGKTRRRSRIADWPGFLAWARASGVFRPDEIRALKRTSGEDNREALLVEVHRLREAARPVLADLAAQTTPPDRRLRELGVFLAKALGRASLVRVKAGYGWRAGTDRSGWVVDALALHVEELLRTDELSRLRECGRCTWLFIDRGRGRGRRWCDMRTCGNRAKAEAYRTR